MATKNRRHHTRRRKSSHRHRRNPARRVYAARRRRAAPVANRRRRRRRNTAGTRVVVMAPRRNRRHYGRRSRRRNPTIFGTSMTPFATAKLVGGGLVGVAAAKLIPPMLPASLISSPAMRVIVTLGVSLGAGYLASKVDKHFGDAVTFGGLMQTGSIALNAFVPSIGAQLALAGGRGVGRLGYMAPASWPMPQNPIRAGMQMMAPAAGAGVGRVAYS